MAHQMVSVNADSLSQCDIVFANYPPPSDTAPFIDLHSRRIGIIQAKDISPITMLPARFWPESFRVTKLPIALVGVETTSVNISININITAQFGWFH